MPFFTERRTRWSDGASRASIALTRKAHGPAPVTATRMSEPRFDTITPTIGKPAHRSRAEGARVVLAAADTFRAAAIDQLPGLARLRHAGFHAAAGVEHDRVLRGGALDQALQNLDRGRLLEVEHDRALAEIGGDGEGGQVSVAPAERARPVAFGRLHLDDVGPEVGEVLRGRRSGEDRGEVDDAQPLERAHGHQSSV